MHPYFSRLGSRGLGSSWFEPLPSARVLYASTRKPYPLLILILFFLYFNKTKCKENEFSCTKGTCIPLIKRCDEETDCEDFSDEDKCVLVDIDNNYKVENAPPQKNGSGTGLIQFSLKLVYSQIIKSTGHFLN